MRFPYPAPGSEIWSKKFAFFPKKVQNTTIWLESYYQCKVYESHSWDDTIICYKLHYLNDSIEVQEYLLTQSPLAKVMEENE